MTSLRGKKILLGVSGSIAAYKAALLLRLLMKEGCEVRVIMTSSAYSQIKLNLLFIVRFMIVLL